MVRAACSVYPTRPPGTKVLIGPPDTTLTSNISLTDRAIVYASSLFIVGSVAWVPLCYAWAYRKWKSTPKRDRRRRATYLALLVAAAAIAAIGPHRSRRVGRWVDVKRWRLWRAWLNFIAFEVVSDVGGGGSSSTEGLTTTAAAAAAATTTTNPLSSSSSSSAPATAPAPASASEQHFDATKNQAIFAVIPHGIVPFALAFAALPEQASRAFGEFRPVVATATALFPFVRTFLDWIGAVDASRSAVDRALSGKDGEGGGGGEGGGTLAASVMEAASASVFGSRLGLAPGGIAEMFEGYPKPLTHRDDECAILKSRKGFVRMALKHGVPVVPVYCFGATKMLRRLQLPAFVENLSKLLRVSICIFFGQWGLPIPYRQKLLYVMGRPIFPPSDVAEVGSENFRRQVDEMHKRFCDELVRIFDGHKEAYGWGHKMLRLV